MELLDAAEHCSAPGCGQIDFLPFFCKGCQKHYCLEHRTAAAHSCSKAGAAGGGATVIVCPLCARGVKLGDGEEPDAAFERHAYSDCDPSNYTRVHRKPRCPAAGCKEKLNAVNSFTCKDCSATVCLRHRLGPDHACPGRAAAPAAAGAGRLQAIRSFFSSSSRSGGAKAAASSSGGGSAAAGKQRLAAAASKVGGSLQSQLQEYRSRHQGTGATASGTAGRPAAPAAAAATPPPPQVVDLTSSPAPAPRGGGAAAAELCPLCSASFPSVQALIEHGEAAHAGGWSSGPLPTQQQQQQQQSGGGGGGLERCPHCGLALGDAAALVDHVQRQHPAQLRGGRAVEACALS